MRKLYHGTDSKSFELMRSVLINQNHWQRGKDFGKGFYMTEDLIQAKKWATIRGSGKGIVLEVALEFNQPPARSKNFKETNKEWSDYIFENRVNEKEPNDFDFILGPMADKKIQSQVEKCIYEYYGKEWFYDQIKTSSIGHQIVVTNEMLGKQSISLIAYHRRKARGGWVRVKHNAEDSAAL